MDTTPPMPAHLVTQSLNWTRAYGRPVDGDVSRRTAGDQTVLVLRQQPRPNGSTRGVSFFAPASQELAAVAHSVLGKRVFGCAVTTINTPLPRALKFVHDSDLKLPVVSPDGEKTIITCGQHWTLYTSAADMTTTDFEAAYTELLATCTPCELLAQAGPPQFVVDHEVTPGDQRTLAAVMALESLASCCGDPSAAWLAKLYALHLSAEDMRFEDVSKWAPVAEAVAAALDTWTVVDPRLVAPALEAQDILAAALDYQPRQPDYKAYWEVHPFQFLEGQYSDELYEREVKVCAQAFQADSGLKSKVNALAVELFEKLGASAKQVDVHEGSFMHNGIKFMVKCAIGSSGGASCGSSWHAE